MWPVGLIIKTEVTEKEVDFVYKHSTTQTGLVILVSMGGIETESASSSAVLLMVGARKEKSENGRSREELVPFCII